MTKKESQNARQLAWRKANPEQNKRNYDRYRRMHPEALLLTTARYRAKRIGLPFSLSLEDIVIPKKRPLLGIPIVSNMGKGVRGDTSPSLDRKDPSAGYTPDNIWVISWRANRLKSDATIEELEKLVSVWRQCLPQ